MFFKLEAFDYSLLLFIKFDFEAFDYSFLLIIKFVCELFDYSLLDSSSSLTYDNIFVNSIWLPNYGVLYSSTTGGESHDSKSWLEDSLLKEWEWDSLYPSFYL